VPPPRSALEHVFSKSTEWSPVTPRRLHPVHSGTPIYWGFVHAVPWGRAARGGQALDIVIPCGFWVSVCQSLQMKLCFYGVTSRTGSRSAC
jgi:hypothetical protein